MLISNMVYGILGTVVFLGASYYNHRILRNLSDNSDVSSAMFFLQKKTRSVFTLAALMVLTVFGGHLLIMVSELREIALLADIGKMTLFVAFAGVFYFMYSIADVTDGPKE